tara:strand:+ start:368 stop:631 length:264 start_codon:yes stop_codon:yes gene_type:complete
MLREIKYFIFTIVILIFLFLTGKYYYSDANKKKSYRSLNSINEKIKLYVKNLPILENNTQDVIEYANKTNAKKKKKFYFWELLDKNE